MEGKEEKNIDTKKIIFEEVSKNKDKNYLKKIKYEKPIRLRVETKTWDLTPEDLNHTTQLHSLKELKKLQDLQQLQYLQQLQDLQNDKYNSLIINHIKTKISGYRQQDIFKKRLDEHNLVKFNEVIDLLNNSQLICHYCSEKVYILYERFREMKQWSLDRINNDIGHNQGNLLVSCLDCNLHRRRTNKDAFMFTKNLTITREGL